VDDDPEMAATAGRILALLEPKTSQQWNNVPSSFPEGPNFRIFA
jgi:hypothetical protein